MVAAIAEAQQIASLIDLTTLSEEKDTHESVKDLAVLGETNALKPVAALCILPRFVEQCKKETELPVATVVNFPKGESTIEVVEQEIKDALSFGADEIDLVIPYKQYKEAEGDSDCCFEMVNKARELIPEDKVLKVIIESGALLDEKLIRGAAKDAMRGGADFVKTSTGFVPVCATTDAATWILEEIHAHGTEERKVGFKASGGIRTLTEAKEYVAIAKKIMGADFVDAKTFRFGASSLLKNMLASAEAPKTAVEEAKTVVDATNVGNKAANGEAKTTSVRAAPY